MENQLKRVLKKTRSPPLESRFTAMPSVSARAVWPVRVNKRSNQSASAHEVQVHSYLDGKVKEIYHDRAQSVHNYSAYQQYSAGIKFMKDAQVPSSKSSVWSKVFISLIRPEKPWMHAIACTSTIVSSRKQFIICLDWDSQVISR